MKKIAAVLLLVITISGLTALGAPRIAVDNTTYDFGVVVEGMAVAHAFVLSNLGDQTLEITRVNAACGCTTTTLAKSQLAAGESVALEVLVNTAGFSGSIAKEITVESTDSANPKLVLTIVGATTRPQDYQIPVGDLDYLFYLLIDLREPNDYAAGHLMGAINLPYAELDLWKSRLPQGVLMILYDWDGSLSDQATQTLQQAGFLEARSLLGGLNEWTLLYKGKYVADSPGR
jgi:rhodanese-related sulfurtransferase